MRLLLDTCVWSGAVQFLTNAGNDVVWAGHWDQDPGDDEILLRANAESRILVTLDKDFGELAILRKQSHVGIVRLVNLPARQQGILCQRAVESCEDELGKGAIITVEQAECGLDPVVNLSSAINYKTSAN